MTVEQLAKLSGSPGHLHADLTQHSRNQTGQQRTANAPGHSLLRKRNSPCERE